MTQQIVIDIVSRGILTVLIVALPPLSIGLIAGLIMSIFQTVTSIQEPTLAFIPKILAVFLALIVFGPWMLTNLVEFFEGLTLNFSHFIHPVY